MRVMGLDFGAKTVGVAITDASGTLAQRKEIIRRQRENALRKTYARIQELIQEYEISCIVLGLPLHLDGSVSERANKTLSFQVELERRTGLQVIMQDERLTSVEAEDLMREAGIPKSDWKAQIDMIAAELILQDYLNHRDRYQ
ncbi:MAG: Holliday junction resolvase RuvX [Lachnospiraceae bacterium]|jgi:RNAse H domain protein, YqgF family|nr:Holliday junction resolvase RuvX [Lachnospiraceae bacterium]